MLWTVGWQWQCWSFTNPNSMSQTEISCLFELLIYMHTYLHSCFIIYAGANSYGPTLHMLSDSKNSTYVDHYVSHGTNMRSLWYHKNINCAYTWVKTKTAHHCQAGLLKAGRIIFRSNICVAAYLHFQVYFGIFKSHIHVHAATCDTLKFLCCHKTFSV